ncbi:MAG: hypothetical protein KHX55_06035, partial [Proteobacteria bacterium]|nr:hypothetical protein [Pseudomonadota bacterium]
IWQKLLSQLLPDKSHCVSSEKAQSCAFSFGRMYFQSTLEFSAFLFSLYLNHSPNFLGKDCLAGD